MHIILVYFSQTGNTKKITEAMAETFIDNGHTVKCVALKDANTEDLLKSDLFGIGTPTFESHTPTNVKNFIKALPDFSGNKAFVFATGGGAMGNVLSDMTKILRKKNVNVLNGFFAIGQMHHPAPCILNKQENRPNENDLKKAKEFASGLNDLISGKSTNIPAHSKPNALKQKYSFYNLVGFIGTFDKIIQLLVPKPKRNKNKCSKCGLCAKECPIDTIKMTPYPTIGPKCIRCYRCQNICPTQTFSTNWTIANFVVLSLWNTFFMKSFGEYNE